MHGNFIMLYFESPNETKMKIQRILTNGEILTVEETDYNNYFAKVSSDKENLGFDGDRGIIGEEETLGSIADEIESWLNDNINF